MLSEGTVDSGSEEAGAESVSDGKAEPSVGGSEAEPELDSALSSS